MIVEQEVQEYDNFDAMVKDLGFEGETEFLSMVASVDLLTQLTAFQRWQDEDGTKSGLVNVINDREYDDNGL